MAKLIFTKILFSILLIFEILSLYRLDSERVFFGFTLTGSFLILINFLYIIATVVFLYGFFKPTRWAYFGSLIYVWFFIVLNSLIAAMILYSKANSFDKWVGLAQLDFILYALPNIFFIFSGIEIYREKNYFYRKQK